MPSSRTTSDDPRACALNLCVLTQMFSRSQIKLGFPLTKFSGLLLEMRGERKLTTFLLSFLNQSCFTSVPFPHPPTPASLTLADPRTLSCIHIQGICFPSPFVSSLDSTSQIQATYESCCPLFIHKSCKGRQTHKTGQLRFWFWKSSGLVLLGLRGLKKKWLKSWLFI